MAYEIPNFMLGVLAANQDLSSESFFQYTWVSPVPATGAGIFASAAVAPPGGTGNPALGVLQNNPQLAEAATVMVQGVSKVKAGATITIGQRLMVATDVNGAGVMVPATAGNYQVAQALEAAVAGDIFTAILVRHGKN